MQPNTIAALDSAVEDGQLWIDAVLVAEGTPERCALRYEQLADQVDAQIETVSAAVTLPGFGGFDSGAALRGGFEDKATDAIAALRRYSATARQLAHTFRIAAAAYQQADSEVAAAVQTTAAATTGVSGA
ncbi:hypothetical protein [Nocardia sp. NPDC024068]|uniref:hypothetical protein n=1 Tax=Nocardia sp. NPDC024068 TaxID=3157197 RepID=UPI0034011DA8